MPSATYPGFPRQTPRFFRSLAKNNDRAWFEEHRSEFDEHVLEPARGFVLVMGERLRRIAPDVNADPRTDRSIFRIHRDTRFSKDKSPYKTHLGIFFWEGDRAKMECPGYYFHLEPPDLMLGVGLYRFSKPVLARYREAVADGNTGGALRRIVDRLARKGWDIGGTHYKRVPRGFDPEHPNADLLRHAGLYAGVEVKIPAELHTGKCIGWCFDRWKAADPLQRWLVENLG